MPWSYGLRTMVRNLPSPLPWVSFDISRPFAILQHAHALSFPRRLHRQVGRLRRDLLGSLSAPADLMTLAGAFEGRRTAKRLAEIERLLETLAALGQARQEGGRWT